MYGISDAQSCKSTSITVIFTSEVIRTMFFLWFVCLICLTGNMMPKILNGIWWNWADRFPVSLDHVLIILSQQAKAITDTMCMSNCTHTHTHTCMLCAGDFAVTSGWPWFALAPPAFRYDRCVECYPPGRSSVNHWKTVTVSSTKTCLLTETSRYEAEHTLAGHSSSVESRISK